jgi:hypothetical protein
MEHMTSQHMSQTFPSPPRVLAQNLPAKPQTTPNRMKLKVIGILDPANAERWNTNQAIARNTTMPKHMRVAAITWHLIKSNPELKLDTELGTHHDLDPCTRDRKKWKFFNYQRDLLIYIYQWSR